MKGHYCGVPSGGAERGVCSRSEESGPRGGGGPVQLRAPLPLGPLSSCTHRRSPGPAQRCQSKQGSLLRSAMGF